MEYDAIVIGAGVGGCAAGAALAGAGKKVLVLERTDRLGGRCSTEVRDGYPLDINSTTIARSEFGPYMEALKRVGKENACSFGHVEKAMLRMNGESYVIPIKPIMDFIKQFAPTQLMAMAGQMVPAFTQLMDPVVQQRADQSIEEFITTYTDSLPINNLLNTFTLYVYGTPYWMTSMGEFMQFVIDLMGPSMQAAANGEMCVGFLKGGLLTFSDALCKGIEEHGGEVRTGVGVDRILVENGRVKGVVTSEGKTITAEIVLSNAGIKETVKDLVGTDKFAPEYAGYVKKLIPGISGTCLRLMLDKEVTDIDLLLSIPPKDTMKFYHEVWDEHKIPDELPPIIATVPSIGDPDIVPKGHQLILAINAISFEPKENWAKWEEKVLGTVLDAWPEAEGHIVWKDWLTPGTYLVFGEEQSPAIGLAQCVGQVRDKRPSSKSPIEGLYFVGGEAGRNVSGMATEMAIGSGLQAADYVLTHDLDKEKEAVGS